MHHSPINRPLSSSACPKCGVSLPAHAASVCPLCLIDSNESHACLFGGQDLQLPYRLGDYQLLSKLGEGGMGVVFEAEHTGSSRRLALKILKEFAGDERERQRFLREGELASSIDHPHSVYVFGTEEIDGLLVISMELATAGTLREEVARRGPLPIREAVDRILEVLSALEVAHAKGVLHRDIKPSNCFLDAENRTLLGDYGLSISPLRHAASEPLTQSGTFIGTPSYCAPEQIRGMALDPRADFYSLASTLYFLLSGKSPLEAFTPLEAIAAALEGRIPSIRERRPDVPKDLAAVLTRALSPTPENRFQDHAAFRQALLPWSSQAPTPAPLGLRFLAGLTDLALLGLGLSIARGFRASAQPTSTSLSLDSTDGLIAILILSLWALAECRWGTSSGKWLLGLRLAIPGGGKAPASKVLLRTALFSGILIGVFVLWTFVGYEVQRLLVGRGSVASEYTWSSTEGGMMTGSFPIRIVLLLLHLLSAPIAFYLALFRRIFRHPEHAALHDRLSGLRVVLPSSPPARPSVPEALEGLRLDCPADSETWGPIQVGPVLENGLRVGVDPRLYRRVLLEKQSAKTADARRWCQRASRLRWLQSVRDGEGSLWEVWQAPSGSPLNALLAAAPVPWNVMLDWMRQIAREIREAAKEGTLPDSLSLEHVWITSDHRALLLDAPWHPPATAEDAPRATESPNAIQACQGLLLQMMQTCPHWSRPLHSDSLLTSLQNASIERFTHLLGLLNVLRKKKPALSQKMRESMAIAFFLTPLLLPVLSAFWTERANEVQWAKAFPSLPPLPRVLIEMAAFHPSRHYYVPPKTDHNYWGTAPDTAGVVQTKNLLSILLSRKFSWHLSVRPIGGADRMSPRFAITLWSAKTTYAFRWYDSRTPERTALAMHIRGHYASLLDAEGNIAIPYLQLPLREDLNSIRAALAPNPDLPELNAQNLSDADRRITEFLEGIRLAGIPLGVGTQELLGCFNLHLGDQIPAAALLQCLSILVLGSPALMLLAGTACVSLRRRPAGRLRMLARWALVWVPAWWIQNALFMRASSHFFGIPDAPHGDRYPLLSFIGAALLPLLIACASLFPRNRCLLDRLTGIWKVQR